MLVDRALLLHLLLLLLRSTRSTCMRCQRNCRRRPHPGQAMSVARFFAWNSARRCWLRRCFFDGGGGGLPSSFCGSGCGTAGSAGCCLTASAANRGCSLQAAVMVMPWTLHAMGTRDSRGLADVGRLCRPRQMRASSQICPLAPSGWLAKGFDTWSDHLVWLTARLAPLYTH